jgi:hypothetical protein
LNGIPLEIKDLI